MSITKSIFTDLIIESNDGERTVDLKSSVLLFEYYEDIFSPIVTAKLKIINSSNTVPSYKNLDGFRQSLYNGLPLRGGERILLKIDGNSDSNPGLDFSSTPEKYFYVSSITDVLNQGDKEMFTLHLVSRESITNETSRVPIKFPTSLRISDSVEKILKEYLFTNKIGKIDKTSNKYGFIGNMRKPFTILTWLSSKAVPEISGGGTAGFVFYETVDGFQFRSLDQLMLQKPVSQYYVRDVFETYDDDFKKVNNDRKILNYYIDKNQNLVEKMRIGAYSSKQSIFNPLNFNFDFNTYNSDNYKDYTKNLGDGFKFPILDRESNLTVGDVPTRNMTFIADIGTMESKSSIDINSDPLEYQAQSLMRYNTLFTQTANIMVSSNTNLKAGDVIECLFPKTTEASSKEYDPETSGLYIIKEVCHHFSVDSSYTSLKLIRDTFGSTIEPRKD